MGFASTRDIKSTRKQHFCEGCGKVIPIGSPSFYWAGDSEGDFYSCHYHVECRAAEVAWNDKAGSHWDEWSALCLIRDEPDDIAWLLAEHPIAAERLGISATPIDVTEQMGGE